MIGREVFGLATTLAVITLLAYMIANGDKTASVLTAAGTAYGGLLKDTVGR